ncbi:MAG: hypothetical protein CM15mP102_03660 [Flavobacteriales bacterium]|nr:MAG: hypothetical protein CM15mP102_03660 [Flavobacteriales bacterium]
MKKKEAIIRKSKFDEVVNALHDAEVYFFSYWDVTGVGNEKIGKVYRGITFQHERHSKNMLIDCCIRFFC